MTAFKLLEKFIQSSLKKFGYRVAKLRPKLPPATFENISLALEYYTKVYPNATFIQIGACDGTSSDSVNSFVKSGYLRSILIEPITNNFERLKTFYNGVPFVTLIKAAVNHTDGMGKIFYVKEEGRWKNNAWAIQLASFDRDLVRRHGIKEEEIGEEEVRLISLNSVLKECNFEKVDILQIDVEGFDAEVVRMALKLEHLPSIICFEYAQFITKMSADEVLGFYELLKINGYSWSHDKLNTLAIHERVIKPWVHSGENSLIRNSHE